MNTWFDTLRHLDAVSAQVALVYPWFWPAVYGVIGLVFGSFMTCALYRVPRGESLWYPPSQCPSCHTPLRALDLIPVVSWVVFAGKCRHCGLSISAYYTLTELVSTLLALGAWWVAGPTLRGLPLFGGVMCILFVGVLAFKWRCVAWRTFIAAGVFVVLYAIWPI